MNEEHPMIVKVYCDESRQQGAPYILMGGIWILRDYGWPFVNEFRNICNKCVGQVPHHLKWTKVPTKSDAMQMGWYTALIDLYFKYNAKKKTFFRALVVDSTYDFTHPSINMGDYEEGFHKLYYQLLLHQLELRFQYHIRVASRSVCSEGAQRERLQTLMAALNNGFRKKFRVAHGYDVVLTVEPRDARDRYLIQLADIFTGAVGYHWTNEHLKSTAREGKVFLASYIGRKLGRHDLKFTTSRKFPAREIGKRPV